MKTIVVIVSIMILIGIVLKNFLARRKEMGALRLTDLIRAVKQKLEHARSESTKDSSKKTQLGTIDMLIKGRPVEKIPAEELEEIDQRLNALLGKGRGMQKYVPGQKLILPSQKIEHARREKRAEKDAQLREKAKNAMKENKERW